MAYTLMILGKDPDNRLIKHCPSHPTCPDESCPLCDTRYVAAMTGCSDCFSGNKLNVDGPPVLGPTDAAEAFVVTFENKDAAQSWIDSWPSPSSTFEGKLVYGFEPNFPAATAS